MHALYLFVRYCLAYCYFDIIDEELQAYATEWNCHYVKMTHGARCPPGGPNDLYVLPQLTGMYHNIVVLCTSV